jgi:AbrB family looped-hinge helix DNA binding protein
MNVTIDSVGRVVLPKALRERLGLVPGSTVDISMYGDGLHLAPAGRTARIEERNGALVAVSDTAVTDDDIFELIESVRR